MRSQIYLENLIEFVRLSLNFPIKYESMIITKLFF